MKPKTRIVMLFIFLLEKKKIEKSKKKNDTLGAGGVHGAYAGYRTDAELRNTYSIKNAADAAGERERERERDSHPHAHTHIHTHTHTPAYLAAHDSSEQAQASHFHHPAVVHFFLSGNT